MLKTYLKKTPRKTAAIWIICGEKKETHPKYTKDDNIVFHIKYLNVLYINNIHEEELFDLILLFLITPIYNWNSNTSFKV